MHEGRDVMASDPRDDFSIFDAQAHMFFGLPDPFALVRNRIEQHLVGQVPGTQLEAIECFDEAKFLTLARRLDDHETKVIVSYFGVCCRANIEVVAPGHAEQLAATLTLLCGEWDKPGVDRRVTLLLDLHADAGPAFGQEAFEQRFLAFRHAADS